jgi:hypothetical protein
MFQVTSTLPADWGTVEFIDDCHDHRIVVLFTHDIDNEGARRNEFRCLLTLIETDAIRLFGAEGERAA